MTTIMRGCVGAWANPAAELAASQSPETVSIAASGDILNQVGLLL